jgi:Ni/Co efflux regulator RcnB
LTKFIKIAALAAATLAMTAAPMAASAQSRHGGDRDHRRYEHNDRRGDYRHDRRDDRRGDYRYDRRDDRRGDYRNARRYYRGATLPRQYRSNWYIRDYNLYGYAPPPRGYGYYRTDTGDIVVAALATGVILSLLNR